MKGGFRERVHENPAALPGNRRREKSSGETGSEKKS
jgi:hypothetical protein